ncbi:MAG TPA: restriction endonuclease [Armatimonadota bacterium]
MLIYTGAGREGDQTLTGANRRLAEQVVGEFPVYGFVLVGSRRSKAIGANRWRFLGLLEYLRHYPEFQTDVRKVRRSVWLFEFRIHAGLGVVPVERDAELAAELLRSPEPADVVTADDRELDSTQAPALEPQRYAEIESVRQHLLGLDPSEFERVIGRMLRESGFSAVEVTRYSQDGGIDVNAVVGDALWPLHGLSLQVQAKRWLHTVGRKEVAELRGSLQPYARGAIVTTSHFSRGCYAL